MNLELIEVEIADLIIGSNVRAKLRNLGPLTASIRERGILEPVLVARDGDKFRLVAGGRRVAAATEAGLAVVPAVVRAATDAQGIVEDQLSENLLREALSTADEVDGFRQLEAFGMTPKEIAHLVGLKVEHVDVALEVAKSEVALAAADAHDLTLEQAAAIADFDGDKAAVKVLVATARKKPEEFPHVLADLVDERERRQVVDELRAKAEKEGTPIIKVQPSYSIDTPPTRLSELNSAAGKNVTPANHRKCPGHAAYLLDSKFSHAQLIYVCTDPKGNGHKARFSGDGSAAAKSPEDREKDATERREMLAGNKEWRVSEPVRRKFIAELVQRAKPPKGVLRFLVEEIMGDPNGLGGKLGPVNERLLGEFLGGRYPVKPAEAYRYGRELGLGAARRAPDARLPLVLLAQIAADREQFMDQTTWRSGSAASARWLSFLEAQGYGLSDIEKKAAART